MSDSFSFVLKYGLNLEKKKEMKDIQISSLTQHRERETRHQAAVLQNCQMADLYDLKASSGL